VIISFECITNKTSLRISEDKFTSIHVNENPFRNRLSKRILVLVSLLSILEMGTCALVAVSEERLLALLIIKLEPLTSVHTSRLAVLCRERWPGRRLACPVRLLGGRCDCRLSAGQDAVFSPPPSRPPSSGSIIEECTTPWSARRFTPVVYYMPLSPFLPHTLCGWMNVPVTDLFHWWGEREIARRGRPSRCRS